MRFWLVMVLMSMSVIAQAQSADDKFRALYEREWNWRLQESPQLATNVGVHDYDARLESVTEKTQLEHKRYLQGVLKELATIERTQLTPTQQVNYAIYQDQITNALGSIEVQDYLLPLNSDSSFYGDLAQLPQSLNFATVSDYRNYIARLNDVPRYFDENIELMRLGIKRGITVPQVVLRGRDAALRGQVDIKQPSDSGFYAPFKKMPESISASDAEQLRAEASKAIHDRVIPAYAKVLKFMQTEYVPKARKSIAAYALPNGKNFYQQQIRTYTTLNLSPQEIHAIGLKEVARIHAEMETIITDVKFSGNFAAFLKFLRTDPQFYAKTPEELLMRASWIAKRVDAQLPHFFGKLPRLPFGIAPVAPEIAPFYTSGRYAGAAEGSHAAGFYWVNTYELPSRTLYTLPSLTLHESAPGHHTQVALASEQGEQPPFRRYSYISAFGEGWALYAEHLGIEMGIYQTPYENFGRLTYEMWRACRLVVDTGMHAKGWTREQALAFMHDNTALSEHEIETETDRYISWPGQALSYKLGELKIRELRASAEKQLGAKFDIRAFHDAVLSLGSVPLPLLEERINAFIAESH